MLTEQFEEALVFATQLHRNQRRKGSGVPYVSHLLSTAALAIEFGGDEDQAIAALLHDSLEDQAEQFGGVDKLREEILSRFGPGVLQIVEACTDATETPKPDWWTRKRAYIEHIRSMDPRAAFVSLCDKIHNARSICVDIVASGDGSVFERFQAGMEGTLWYYQALVEAFEAAHPQRFSRLLRSTVEEMVTLAADAAKIQKGPGAS
jgi:GTP pyrophosphokinase